MRQALRLDLCEPGLFAQTFGDYCMERAAPLFCVHPRRQHPITNRNKVYTPDHLLVLTRHCSVRHPRWCAPGALILLNTAADPSAFHDVSERFRLATVNATEIARKHGIAPVQSIIVNTAIVGAYARLADLPISILEKTYSSMGLQNDLRAAQMRTTLSSCRKIREQGHSPACAPTTIAKPSTEVIALTDHKSRYAHAPENRLVAHQSPLYRTAQAPCNAACLRK